ncbi:hypothetical protein SteCoe_23918 [Stentor coeruleus]|uniref:Uncharacterized protein n=1 Tax=Stentor coeruleus TaxID=5963 RepID=A0A1R2BIQ6_9CILI|nr:hypothetical protein SteCoe_23918 [Stentor coeruleus]
MQSSKSQPPHTISIPSSINITSHTHSKNSIQDYDFSISTIHEDLCTTPTKFSNKSTEKPIPDCEAYILTPIPKESIFYEQCDTSFMTKSFIVEIEAGIMVTECKGAIKKLNARLDENFERINRESMENFRLKQAVNELQDKIDEKKQFEMNCTKASCGCFII